MNDPKIPLRSPSLWWRLFFGLECMIIFLNVLGVSLSTEVGLIEIIDFTTTNLAFVALCGFIFNKAIGTVVFWRYFFYVALIETFIVLIILPIFAIPIYGTTMTFGWWLFNCLITYFSLVALNIYAYKIPAIWQQK